MDNEVVNTIQNKEVAFQNTEEIARWGDGLLRERLDHLLQSDLNINQHAEQVAKQVKMLSSLISTCRSLVLRKFDNPSERQEILDRLGLALGKFGTPVSFSLDNFQEENDSEKIAYLDTYYHDISNVIQLAQGYVDMLPMFDLTPGSKDQEYIDIIPSSLLDLKDLLKSFSLSESELSKEPVRLIDLLNYILKLKARPTSKNDQLEVNFDFEGFSYEQLSDPDNNLTDQAFMTSELNIPALLRIYYNVIQNTKKSYQVMSEKGLSSSNTLRIGVALQKNDTDGSFILINFDDDGIGFPQFEGAEKQQSLIDESMLILFEPARGKTEWSESVKGTGVGLASFNEHLNSIGGTFLTGTRVSQETGQAEGARLEIKVPLKNMRATV